MVFDWSINFGHIMTFVTLLASAVAFAFNQRTLIHQNFEKVHTSVSQIATTQRFEAQQTALRLDKMEARMDEIAAATIAIARQDERMKHFEHRLETLEEDVSKFTRAGH